MSGTAENKANVKFSYKKYYSFRNKINHGFGEKFYSDMRIDYVSQALCFGDTQPCVVVGVNPLLIAAYSDEMDAVVMLEFPAEFADLYHLAPGSRLTSSNIYFYGDHVSADIFPGIRFSGSYADFMPLIQLFLGKNDEKIAQKVNLFSEQTWEKVNEKASAYLDEHPGMKRFGFSCFKKNA